MGLRGWSNSSSGTRPHMEGDSQGGMRICRTWTRDMEERSADKTGKEGIAEGKLSHVSLLMTATEGVAKAL